MTFAYAKMLQTEGPTPILRIIRQNGRFLCGVCRQSHIAESAATTCLKRCIQTFLTQDPVSVMTGTAGEQFRCRFCCREYLQYNDANQCASECKERLVSKDQKNRTFVTVETKKPRKLQFKGKPKALFTPSKVKEVVISEAALLEEIAPLATLPKSKKAGVTPAVPAAPAAPAAPAVLAAPAVEAVKAPAPVVPAEPVVAPSVLQEPAVEAPKEPSLESKEPAVEDPPLAQAS